MAVKTQQEISNHVGARLREIRKARGLKQADIGNMLGVTYQQVQKFETGQNRLCAAQLYVIADALTLPVSFFFDFLGE